MEDFEVLYYNNFGVTFYLKRSTLNEFNKVQLVFNKEVVLNFNVDALNKFKIALRHTIESIKTENETRLNQFSFVLEIPNNPSSYAFKFKEIKALLDLVKGTLFHLNFEIFKNQLIET